MQISRYFLSSLLIYTKFINSLYLTNENYKIIISLIKNPLTKSYQREKINKIMYYSYENWAVKKAFEFKKKHSYKCRDIQNAELFLYTKYALYKSIVKYNGQIPFINYSMIYISASLNDAITDRFSLSILPKNYRRKSKRNFTLDEINNYNRLLHVKMIDSNYDNKLSFLKKKGYESSEGIDNNYYDSKMNSIWNIINNFDPFTKRVYQLKYDYEFNKIRTNKEISVLMACSEEYIRKKITDSQKLETIYESIL
jgi:hypothetical protein